MRYILTFAFLILLNILQVNAQLVSGPVLGYVTHREAAMALEVEKGTKQLSVKYWPVGKQSEAITQPVNQQFDKKHNPVKIVLPDLEMNTDYEYQVIINNSPAKLPYRLSFKTTEIWEWRKDAPDFTFLLGSCAYINDSIYDRPGKPYGQSTEIFKTMAKEKADFNLWNGDNVYLREADYTSESGINYRYCDTRQTEELQKVFALRPNFALWDDHDYGPNDANGSYHLKQYSRNAFMNYWPNPTFGEHNEGVYTKVSWSDCDFFLMDCRWFRSSDRINDTIDGVVNKDKHFFGKMQLDWLFNSLLQSRGTFKFIVVGGQMLNPKSTAECLRDYAYEFKQLTEFIKTYKIQGVVFLTGDRHFTELIKDENITSYPLYDFTSSPLTSGPYRLTEKNPEFNNPARVPGSLYTENNFSKLSVTGKRNNRVLSIETLDVKGESKWKFEIKESDLKIKKQ